MKIIRDAGSTKNLDTTHMAKLAKLADGTQLSYAEYGRTNGIPILVHHGNPGSRLFWGMLPGSPFDRRYRLLSPDRPGYGYTDHFGTDSITRWPGMVEELLSNLGVESVYNVGVSGGAPYALACSLSIPERIKKTLLISPLGPLTAGSVGDMNANRFLFSLIGKLPWLFRLQFKLTTRMLKKNPEGFFNLFQKKLAGRDRELAESGDIRSVLADDFLEGHRQGEAGSFYDSFLPSRWPIDHEAISGQVEIWYGDEDRSIGDMGKYLAENIRNSELHIVENAGHLLILEMAKEILNGFVV